MFFSVFFNAANKTFFTAKRASVHWECSLDTVLFGSMTMPCASIHGRIFLLHSGVGDKPKALERLVFGPLPPAVRKRAFPTAQDGSLASVVAKLTPLMKSLTAVGPLWEPLTK